MRALVLLCCLLPAAFAQNQGPVPYSYNLILHPEDLTKANWTSRGGGGTITYGVTAQDGTSTATRIVSNGNSAVSQTIGVPASTTYTLSAVAKANGTGGWLLLALSDLTANAFQAYFNLNTGVLGTGSGVGSCTFISASITSLGSGWYQVSVTGTSATAGGNTFIDIHATNADNAINGAFGNGLDMWHTQLNAGSSVVTWGTTAPTPKFQYFGFSGDPDEWFRGAGSNDGVTWFGYAGIWDTPIKINAPQVLYYKGQYYFHQTKSNSGALNEYLWWIGLADSTGAVTIQATIDWSSKITSLTSCYVGGWLVPDDGTLPHLFIPCSAVDHSHFKIYETQALTSALTTWSDPVLVLATGNYQDPKPFLIGTTYYLWLATEATHQIQLATATTLLGPYTVITSGDWAGWGSNIEGPTMFRNSTASGWTMALESILNRDTPNHKMYNTTCNNVKPDLCTWSALTPWSKDMLLRHGSIIRTPLSPAGILGMAQ